jgi:hypothetical protein
LTHGCPCAASLRGFSLYLANRRDDALALVHDSFVADEVWGGWAHFVASTVRPKLADLGWMHTDACSRTPERKHEFVEISVAAYAIPVMHVCGHHLPKQAPDSLPLLGRHSLAGSSETYLLVLAEILVVHLRILQRAEGPKPLEKREVSGATLPARTSAR